VPEWQPIRTAPKDGTCILALLPDSDVPHVVFYNNGTYRAETVGWHIQWDHTVLQSHDEPIRWMHLPTDAAQKCDVQPPSVAVPISAIQQAYGYLWHVNNGLDAPAPLNVPSVTPEKAAYQARRVLRDLLTHKQRGEGINAVRAEITAPCASPADELTMLRAARYDETHGITATLRNDRIDELEAAAGDPSQVKEMP